MGRSRVGSMALYARSYSKHAFLPSAVSAFLRRRFGQLVGFMMVCLAVILAAALGTYHFSDPSWNFAIDGPTRNILAFPGAVIADIFLQTFGIASLYWIVAFMGWGVRSIAAIPFRWGGLRLLSLVLSVLLASCVAAQFTLPKTWALPNSLGGAFGVILLHHVYGTIGSSWITFIGVGLLFFFLSLFLLCLGVGLSFKQVISGILFTGYQLNLAFLWTSQALYRLFIRGRKRLFGDRFVEKEFEFSLKKEKLSSDTKNNLLLTSTEQNQGVLRITDEDKAIHVSSAEKPKSPLIWREDFSSIVEESEILDQESSAQTSISKSKSSSFSSNLADASLSEWEDYELPSLDLLDPSLNKAAQVIDSVVLEESAYHLCKVLEEFGVRGEVMMVRPGPVVTMYEFKPAAGIKTSRVIGLADDIARSMSALSARIAVIPGRNVIGIELPNPSRETVFLRELLHSELYEKATAQLAIILGKDIGGQPVIADLTRMPHLLVAGTTGSGKSVAVNTMILSLLFRLPPDRCKFIMIDPKMLELSVYDGIPHLLTPVVTDPKKAIVALKWAVREMENRYRAMSKLGVRNIDGYNARIREARQSGELLVRRVQTGFDPDSGKPVFENQPLDIESLPYIVVVVDEMADLMMVAGKEIEAAVQRLAQMARAAGIHLIMATQRPSVDVITGTIKANFPTRISFQVTSKIDSRTILGEQGAEQLLGQGDMLYMVGGGRISRVHGPFVRDDEVERVVAFLKTQADPVYIESVTHDEDELFSDDQGVKGQDSLYQQAVELVMREGKASTSFIQRHLQIGYNKAAGIIEAMEKNGIVSQANHVGRREVLR